MTQRNYPTHGADFGADYWHSIANLPHLSRPLICTRTRASQVVFFAWLAIAAQLAFSSPDPSTRPTSQPTADAADSMKACHVVQIPKAATADSLSGSEVAEAGNWMNRGHAQAARGDANAAAASFDRAMRLFAVAGRDRELSVALCELAAIHFQSGNACQANAELEAAQDVAERVKDPLLLMRVENSLGVALTFTRHFVAAEAALDRALSYSQQAGPRMKAAALLNRGILRAAEASRASLAGRIDSTERKEGLDRAREFGEKALEDFDQALALAQSAKDPLLAAKAASNAALTAAARQDADDFSRRAERAQSLLSALPESRQKGVLLTTLGRAWQQMRPVPPEADRKAQDLLSAAIDIAQQSGDSVTASYAAGLRGFSSDRAGDESQAKQFTQTAIFLAQKSQSPSSLYRWHWQMGRLLARSGRNDEAILAMQAAVSDLQNIRLDVATGLGGADGGSNYRDEVGPLYSELADLLLRRADAAAGEADQQRALSDARDVMDQLRAAEIDNFFIEPCARPPGTERPRTIEGIDPHAAVIYFISLKDRTEAVFRVGQETGLRKVRLSPASDLLDAQARQFRRRLETRTHNRFMYESRELYNELIAPLEGQLSAAQVQTLVFVPDGELLTIPFAALNDGKQFLIERFAVAVVPGATLIDPRPPSKVAARTLAAGFSQPRGNFAALTGVPEEISGVAQQFPGSTSLLDGDFTVDRITGAFQAAPYRIIHIASHCELGKDIESSYILTSEGQLSPQALETLLLPAKFRDQPVDLLTLSACETAEGDNYRAALGLGGLGIKCGARSALATLWAVNDQSSAKMMGAFYGNLSQTAPKRSKAEALRRAQVQLMSDVRYRHPCYWAPYLLIGNWR